MSTTGVRARLGRRLGGGLNAVTSCKEKPAPTEQGPGFGASLQRTKQTWHRTWHIREHSGEMRWMEGEDEGEGGDRGREKKEEGEKRKKEREGKGKSRERKGNEKEKLGHCSQRPHGLWRRQTCKRSG